MTHEEFEQLLLLTTSTDERWSREVKKRDGKCMYCATTVSLQAAHIIGRGAKYLRRRMVNGITLCAKHHTSATNDAEHEETIMRTAIRNKYGDDTLFDFLNELRYKTF